MSEETPIIQVAHFQLEVADYMVYEPSRFGKEMEGLRNPTYMIGQDFPFRINLATLLYSAALGMEAEIVEGDCSLWPFGSQEQYNRFVSYHTLREGWEYPRADSIISWKFKSSRFNKRFNLVCVASKYDGKDTRDGDAWFFDKDGQMVEKKGLTIGMHAWDDMDGFMDQYAPFEEPFMAALRTAAAKTGRTVQKFNYP